MLTPDVPRLIIDDKETRSWAGLDSAGKRSVFGEGEGETWRAEPGSAGVEGCPCGWVKRKVMAVSISPSMKNGCFHTPREEREAWFEFCNLQSR